MPGDKIRAQLSRKRGGVYSGKLEEIIASSPQRIQPRCVHFSVCGGCRLQHVPYSDQLNHKESYIRNCFKQILNSAVAFHSILPSPQEWEYRNKMEYSFSSDLKKNKYLGLIMDSSRGKVLNLTECFLTDSWFIEALKCVNKWWNESDLDAYHCPRDTGALRTLILREGKRTGERMVVLTVSGNPEYALRKHHLKSFVTCLRNAIEPDSPNKLSIFLRIQQIAKGTATTFYEMHLYGPDHIKETLHITLDPAKPMTPITFCISPAAFFQPNPMQAERLYSKALEMAEIPSDAVVYDLYCGAGALGISISKKVKQVIGIELSPESSLDARTNAKQNGCDNVTIITGNVGTILGKIEQQELPKPDVVLVDPPRVGLDPETIQHLLSFRPKKIVYVSCNPSTQALNVSELVDKGYKLTAIQPMDQFPQTAHVENIAILVDSCR
jgi:23S rRNA (uracil1939-C5)-methyltransferase